MQFLLNQICLKCRVKLCMLSKSMSSSAKNGINIAVFQQLGFTENEAKQMIARYTCKRIGKLNTATLEQRLAYIKKLGFNQGEIVKCPNVLGLTTALVDHHYKILEESGFSVREIKLDSLTYKFHKFMKYSATELKDKGLINKDIDVTRNILSYSDLPSGFDIPDTDDSQKIGLIQNDAVKMYLCWRLNMKREEVEKLFKSYPYLYFKSIRLLIQCYNIVTNNIGMPLEKIKNNGYVLQGHPDNYLDLLQRLPTLAEEPIQPVIVGIPKLLLSTTDTILEILKILKEDGVHEVDVRTLPRVLTLSADTVRDRLRCLHSDPNFKPYFHNRRRLKMVLHFHCTKVRTKILKEKNWRCRSLELLSVGSINFDRRMNLGDDSTIGQDTVSMLEKELGLTSGVLRNTLKQHPRWSSIPVSTVAHTLEFLWQVGFQPSQITSCLHVLLYPMEDVKKNLQLLETNPEVDCCRDSTGKVRPELVLHLVLYFLERPYHFTGDGIWGENSPDVKYR